MKQKMRKFWKTGGGRDNYSIGENVETISPGHLNYVYVLLAVVVALITIGVAGKHGVQFLMKGKFMETDEIKETLLTKEEFEHQCFVKKSACTTKICDKIKEIKAGQEIAERSAVVIKEQVEKDAVLIKIQVEKNLVEVKEKINGVSAEVKELRTSMQIELKQISHFMGGVEQWMKKNNVGNRHE